MPVPGNETTSYCLADLNLNFTVDAMLLPRRSQNRSSFRLSLLSFPSLFLSLLTAGQAGAPGSGKMETALLRCRGNAGLIHPR